SGLADKDMMKRVHVFSKGNMRRIRKLINRASRLAINEGQESLLLKHFEKAALKVSRDACTPNNPFSIPVDELKIEHPPENVGWENYLIQQDKDVSIDDAL
ncbi:TPA: transposase, partial [Vibrio antiquarius]